MARFAQGNAPSAAAVSYDNATSGLTATDTQAAVDELAAAKQPAGSGQGTAEDLGEITTGTITPEPDTGVLKTLTNGGVFTWAAPTQEGGYIATVLNNGSAGAITASGFDIEESASFDTTDTNQFEVCVTNDGIRKIMTVRALQ